MAGLIIEQEVMAKTILLVDDDEAHLLWSTEILREKGYDIEATDSAKEALGFLETKSYDLVISDLRMPEMSGITFVKKIAGIRGGQKAIILTGHGNMETFIETVHGLGVLEYINKPVEIDELVAVIDKLTGADSDRDIPAAS